MDVFFLLFPDKWSLNEVFDVASRSDGPYGVSWLAPAPPLSPGFRIDSGGTMIADISEVVDGDSTDESFEPGDKEIVQQAGVQFTLLAEIPYRNLDAIPDIVHLIIGGRDGWVGVDSVPFRLIPFDRADDVPEIIRQL
jgi:hypothetical protein